MKVGLFAKLFPPPRYLALPADGLDLSDRSLKFVRLRTGKSSLELSAYGEKVLPLDIVQAGEIKNKPALIEILKQAKLEWKLENVVAALPEEKAYIARMPIVGAAANGDWRELIELQLEEYVPLPPGETVFDYEPVQIRPNTTSLAPAALVSALPAQLVQDYEEVLQAAGLRPRAFEIEAQAVARALVPVTSRETAMIIDFGKTRTSFFIVRGQQVLFTFTSAQLGGDIITRALEKSLNLKTPEAEQVKFTRGLLAGEDSAARLTAIVPALSVLRDEVLKLQSFWHDHWQVVEERVALQRAVLCGGEAALPGLVEYLNAHLPLQVELGQVWNNVLELNQTVPDLSQTASLRYATAIGLALKTFIPN
ncbi:MAG: pilus assembly protein PilM [Patescibacteria group bacterium]